MKKPKLEASLEGRVFVIEMPVGGWYFGDGWRDNDAAWLAALDKALHVNGDTYDLDGPFINGCWAITVKHSARTDADLKQAIEEAAYSVLKKWRKA